MAYHRLLPQPAMCKLTAHAGDATSVDWHPTHPYLVATGGSMDRTVKVWDLEAYLNVHENKKDMANLSVNFGTLTSRGESTDASSETDRSQ